MKAVTVRRHQEYSRKRYFFSKIVFFGGLILAAVAFEKDARAESLKEQTAENSAPYYSQYMLCKYNTNAADFNFLELSGISPDSAEYVLEIIPADAQSGAVTSVPQLESRGSGQLAPLSRADIDIHSKVGQLAFGLILVRYSGAELKGAVSYYQLVDGRLSQTAYVPCYKGKESFFVYHNDL